MRRFFVLSAALVGILGMGVGLLLTTVRALPFSDRVQQWHLADCQLPCLAGITVGQTTVDQAEQRLRETFGVTGYVELGRVSDDRGHYDLVWVKRRNDSAQSFVEVTFHDSVADFVSFVIFASDSMSMPSIGEIVPILGAPSCLWTEPLDPRHVIVTYENDQENWNIQIHPYAGLTMAAPTYVISVSRSSGSTCELHRGWKWRGFTSRSPQR